MDLFQEKEITGPVASSDLCHTSDQLVTYDCARSVRHHIMCGLACKRVNSVFGTSARLVPRSVQFRRQIAELRFENLKP